MDIPTNEKDKRSLILHGAMQVFARKGFHEAKVEEIAQEAGVGKGTVYEYFSSKEELFKEMIRAGLDHYSQTVAREVAGAGSVREKLFRVFKTFYEFTCRSKEMMALFMEVHRGIKEDMHKWMFQVKNDQTRLVEGIFREGMARGEFREVDPYLAALMFLGSMRALTMGCIFGDPSREPRDIFDEAMDILLQGLQRQV